MHRTYRAPRQHNRSTTFTVGHIRQHQCVLYSPKCVQQTHIFRHTLGKAIDPSLSIVEKRKLDRLLLDYSEVFSAELGYVDLVGHRIDKRNNAPRQLNLLTKYLIKT